MNRSNLKVFSQAIVNASLSRKTALQLEIAVAFAVHLDCNQAKRLTRAALCEIYSGAGYKASNPGDLDWRAINRRITASFALFEFLGSEDVAQWALGKAKMELINALVAKIEPLQLKTTNEILEICGKVGIRTPKGARPEPAGTQHIDTDHIHIVIPPSATRAEMIDAALHLMKLAEQAAAAEIAEQEQVRHEARELAEAA